MQLIQLIQLHAETAKRKSLETRVEEAEERLKLANQFMKEMPASVGVWTQQAAAEAEAAAHRVG
jgi:hypothetical protein